MQLEDPYSVAASIEDYVKKSRPIWRRRKDVVEFAPVGKRRHCKCGTCERCLEDARWDRIFREKFADPDYYRSRALHHGSSLNWLC
jgi:hypothetical protein